MFMKLLKRLMGRAKHQSESSAEPIVQQLAGTLPDGAISTDQMLVIFSQGQLVNYYRDDPPAERRKDESWWLVPGDDLVLGIMIAVDNETCSVDVSVRFEAEADLLNLLETRESLSRDDLVSVVTSKLAGLVDMLDYPENGSLVATNAGNQERLRARLSLVLQNHGLRCTDISDWQLVETVDPTGEEASKMETVPTDELVEAVQQVSQPGHWDRLVTTLEAGGCQFDQQETEQLDDLGQQVVDHTITTDQATSRLQELIHKARQQAGIPHPELQRWQGLEMRLDTHLPVDSEEAGKPAAEPSDQPLSVTRKRRPGTWWLLSHRAVDDRLLGYLQETLSRLRGEFDIYRSSKSLQQGLVLLRRIDQRLAMALDLVETVPTLRPPQAALRIKRTRIKPLVKHLEAAVTAMETMQAASKAMAKQTTGDDDWNQSCEAICDALDHLNNDLRQRRQVHTSVKT
jgi:hypothetical protein